MNYKTNHPYVLAINDRMPKEVIYLLDTFESYGYEAYVVGGCVRDTIIGKKPKDWDICTSATPDQILNVINAEIIKGEHVLNYHEVGIKHGTVSIGVDKNYFEVTTYRIDGKYEDNRRPSSVAFTSSLEEDLARRDLTINAIAYNPSVGFVDPFNGIPDIENQLICCVGNPDDRFNEDGLRILRALRFSAQLKFYISGDTDRAIHRNKHLLNNISKERINSEFTKIISSAYCGSNILNAYSDVIAQFIPEIKPMIGFQQHNPYHQYSVWGHTIKCLNSFNFPITKRYAFEGNDLISRLAIFFHDIGKPNCFSMDENGIGHFYGHAKESSKIAYEVLTRLRFDNEVIAKTVQLISYHDAQMTPTKPFVKRMLNKIGEEQFQRLISISYYDINGQTYELNTQRVKDLYEISLLFRTVVSQKECFTLKDLDFDGQDAKMLGLSEGKEIGILLKKLLNAVIDGEVKNNYVSLLSYIEDKNLVDGGN